jgi:hypothetical protein
MSYNDLGALPQAVSNCLKLGLRPSRKYAAHRGSIGRLLPIPHHSSDFRQSVLAREELGVR